MALPEYDPRRKRIQSQYAQKKSEGQGAIDRRLASQGMFNSGAAIKLQQEHDTEIAKAEGEALSQVDFLEAQENQRRKEIGEQRAYQTSERVGGQEFSKGLFDKEFGLKERSFQAEQGWKQKEFDQNILTNYITAILGLKDADISADEMSFLTTNLSNLGLRPPPGFNVKRDPMEQHRPNLPPWAGGTYRG
jgi:hypothetical protein